jgi:hypothetical protein
MGTFNLVFAILSGSVVRKLRKQKRLQRGVEAEMLNHGVTAVAHDHGLDK